MQQEPCVLFSERILHIEPLYEPIFDACSAATLLRISRTCRAAHHALAAYTRVAFNVDRLLARFFPTPPADENAYARARAFRSLQARTGTLVSGSCALQFFARAVWPEADLDLYVHMRHRREVGRWLLGEGYAYAPAARQNARFEVEVVRGMSKRANGIYAMPGVAGILTFKKRVPGPQGLHADADAPDADGEVAVGAAARVPGRELKVQIIVAKHTPMAAILGFHSTCVMNVLSYEKAYCLFPQATLEDRLSLLSSSCLGPSRNRTPGIVKYTRRGYTVITEPGPDDVELDGASFAQPRARAQGAPFPRRGKPPFRLGWRWVDDSASWVLRLPLTGVVPPPAPNASTVPRTRDPIAVCNFDIRLAAEGEGVGAREDADADADEDADEGGARGVVMHFEVLQSEVLRYRYVLSDEMLCGFVERALRRWRFLEVVREAYELEDRAYYDEELPALCRDFLHGLATRRLAALRF